MTSDAAAPVPSRQIHTTDELTEDQAATVLTLLADAAAEDGQQAVSEQGRLQLRGGRREGVRHLLLTADGQLIGYAQLEGADPVEPPPHELVVHPAHRGRGHGRALGTALLEASGGSLRLWAHGGHPAARHLATVLGMSLFRELRQMRRPLSVPPLHESAYPEGVTVRTFVPGEDDAAWLAVNAAAFAHHPEQGSLTQRDLDARMAEPWFDPKGFFLAERDGVLVASTGPRSTPTRASARSTSSASPPTPRAPASARPSPPPASPTSPPRASPPPCSTSTPTTRQPSASTSGSASPRTRRT